MANRLPPVHPGQILQEEFLKPMGISQTRLALDLGVPAPRINAVVNGKRSITADTALRLGRYFGMEPEFWLRLQLRFDIETEQDRLEGRLDREVRPRAV